jgi:death-on-curing family protein
LPDLDDRRPPLLATCNQGKIESALAAPQWLQDAAFWDEAACLTYHLVKSHACPDGNKRASLAILVAFLDKNDYEVRSGAEQELTDWIIDLAGSEASQKSFKVGEFANWLGRNVSRRGVRYSPRPTTEG